MSTRFVKYGSGFQINYKRRTETEIHCIASNGMADMCDACFNLQMCMEDSCFCVVKMRADELYHANDFNPWRKETCIQYAYMQTAAPNSAVGCLIPFRTREVPVQVTARRLTIPGWGPSKQMLEDYLVLSYCRFISHSFQFMSRKLSCHLTLYKQNLAV
jgi:hypothetical protein